jgi:hypothetical protein
MLQLSDHAVPDRLVAPLQLDDARPGGGLERAPLVEQDRDEVLPRSEQGVEVGAEQGPEMLARREPLVPDGLDALERLLQGPSMTAARMSCLVLK